MNQRTYSVPLRNRDLAAAKHYAAKLAYDTGIKRLVVETDPASGAYARGIIFGTIREDELWAFFHLKTHRP